MDEYIVQSESLTAVADAIREKAGSSNALVFPSGFVSAIANLGGLPSKISAISSGVYTPTEDVYSHVSIEHGLGQTPDIVIIGIPGSYYVSNFLQNNLIAMVSLKCGYNTTSSHACTRFIRCGKNGSLEGYAESHTDVATEHGTDSVFKVPISGTLQFKTNTPYHWVAMVVDWI